MKLQHIFYSGLCLLLAVIVPVQADDLDRELSEARTVFLQGVDGDRHAVRDATNRFRSLRLKHPAEPVFLAYYGASVTLLGRDAVNNIDRQRLTEKGLKSIDKALELLSVTNPYPASRRLDTLLVAANSFIHIPAFFNRHDDGKRLLQQILADDAFDGMAAGFRAAAYMAAALVARGDEDTEAYRHYLDLTVKADPDGRNGRLARQLLEKE